MFLEKNEKKSIFPQIKLSSNIDFRAVWRFFKYRAFPFQKPGKVIRFHETSLNDQLSHPIGFLFILKLLLLTKKEDNYASLALYTTLETYNFQVTQSKVYKKKN